MKPAAGFKIHLGIAAQGVGSDSPAGTRILLDEAWKGEVPGTSPYLLSLPGGATTCFFLPLAKELAADGNWFWFWQQIRALLAEGHFSSSPGMWFTAKVKLQSLWRHKWNSKWNLTARLHFPLTPPKEEQEKSWGFVDGFQFARSSSNNFQLFLF